jgi:hypothetical protein
MSICLDDVAYWVGEWEATGDIISEPLARKIAEYWQSNSDDGVLAAFARGETVDGDSFRDEIAATICYAKTAGFETIRELYALKDWAMCRG